MGEQLDYPLEDAAAFLHWREPRWGFLRARWRSQPE
jgi:hypothetical protein